MNFDYLENFFVHFLYMLHYKYILFVKSGNLMYMSKVGHELNENYGMETLRMNVGQGQ